MSEFRTILKTTSSLHKIDLTTPVFTIGSCFADHLGAKLFTNKFKVSINPFGTSYNPISIHKLLQYAIDDSTPSSEGFGAINETHFHYDFHSSFSTLDHNTLVNSISHTIKQAHNFLKESKYIIITYGTSWVYERNQDQKIVGNCHKIPGGQFTQSLLTQKKILDSFGHLYEQLMMINPSVKIILTVSPVRHIKDSLERNAVSKSILRLSCHTLSEMHPQVEYFPAYEIVLDDLRDYRFYDRDLLHPSGEAIDYIWRIFGERYFTKDTAAFIKQWDEITKALAHRPYQPTTAMHQKFLSNLLSKLEELKHNINVDKEISQVKNQIKH